VFESVATLQAEHEQLQQQLGDPGLHADAARAKKVNRRYAELSKILKANDDWLQAQDDLAAARELAKEDDAFAAEVPELETGLSDAQERLRRLLIPRDPDDGRDVIMEIKGGAGGAESALFAADLLRMYTRYAERQRWQVEIMSESASDLGGYKEVIVRIAGAAAFSKLKFESGGHRVQRVPATEAQGRIHTSACTVAVMPEADEVGEVEINPSDLRVDTFRASGAGGQHVNKTDSAVRLTHLPTGIVVECQDDRSQHRNKEKAMKVLAARIKDGQLRAAQAKEASTRRNLIGSGDRSDRIRTYNFPQGRVTDHRINLTLYKIDTIMDGDLDELVGSLAAEHQADQLAALGEDA
jgi:peptide chain release factor 1